MSSTSYRGQLERKRRQRLDAEKKASDGRRKEAEKRTAATKARGAAGRSTSQSTIRMKLAEAERRDKEADAAAKDSASWQAKAASYGSDEAKLVESLAKAEGAERKAAEQLRQRHETTRKREQERAEAKLREQLAEAQKELSEQREALTATHDRVDDVVREIRAPKVERLRVLLLGASSDGGLRVGREQSRIRTAVERALHRDLVELDARSSATIEDLMDGITRFRPHVVHFSGHSSETTLEFEKNLDEPHAIGDIASAAAFAQALRATDDPPLLIVLNSCDSAGQLDALVDSTAPFAIGMADEVDDGDAILYATQFYASLANGQSVLAAHDAGRAALALAGLPGSDLPILAAADGADPRAAVLVHPPH